MHAGAEAINGLAEWEGVLIRPQKRVEEMPHGDEGVLGVPRHVHDLAGRGLHRVGKHGVGEVRVEEAGSGGVVDVQL